MKFTQDGPIDLEFILVVRNHVSGIYLGYRHIVFGGKRSFSNIPRWNYGRAESYEAVLRRRFVSEPVRRTAAIGIVAIVNRFWKISAHLTGFGGLVGGIFCYCLGIGAIPTWGTGILWLGLSLMLMYSRLWLNAHTPAQVCTGWLTGIACTFLPYCIYCYAS